MQVYGHRGAKGVFMENSLQGFISAVEQGIEYFELDVRLSSDNQLIVVHDEILTRLANSPLLVSKTPASVLKATLLKGTTEGIPTLKEVINACPHIKHWQLEIKTHSTNTLFVQPMAELIEQYNLQDKVTITSLHRGILKEFKHALPHIPRGYVQESLLPNGIKAARKLGCSMLVLNKKLGKKDYINKAQKKGLHVSMWTVNDINLIEKFKNYGVNSLISDFPQMALNMNNQSVKAERSANLDPELQPQKQQQKQLG
jgi:glycerophosphoryl diester phosphodiesterase